MDDIMKSSSVEADIENDAIKGKEGAIQELSALTIARTNLPVVENLQSIHRKMNVCNQEYKKLLLNHAESIRKLGQEFKEFDSALSEAMGIIR